MEIQTTRCSSQPLCDADAHSSVASRRQAPAEIILKHASPDCCQGHECDHCPTCVKGRCCRKDAPLYQLPKLLEWDGPLYGEPGVLAVDATGDKVQCPLCGAWRVKLGLHCWFEHNRTSAEVRAIWGLRQSTGLAAPNYKAEVRTANTERLRRFHVRPSYVERMTPEQRSALKEGTTLPLQTLRDPSYRATMKRVGEQTTARARLWPCGCGCGNLLEPGNGPHRGQRYIRGHAPPTLAARVFAIVQAVQAGSGEPARRAQIVKELGEETSVVGRALGTLVQQGRLAVVTRGVYALPSEQQEEGTSHGARD